MYLSDAGIYLRDRIFSSDFGIDNFYPSNGTHWVCFINENYFDSYVCSSPNKQSKFIIKRNGQCLYSEYKIQGLTHRRNKYCANNCLYINDLTKVLGIGIKSAVLDFYYQMIQ